MECEKCIKQEYKGSVKKLRDKNLNDVFFELLGTLSNRRRRADDGNRKRDISLRMYNTLGPDVALKLRT